MPEGSIYVGRPSRWGNPFVPGKIYRDVMGREYICQDIDHAIRLHRACAFAMKTIIRNALRGHDLACWCPLDQPCHADVLLELANG